MDASAQDNFVLDDSAHDLCESVRHPSRLAKKLMPERMPELKDVMEKFSQVVERGVGNAVPVWVSAWSGQKSNQIRPLKAAPAR
jgi:hypothetical protein